jgi:membrane protein DedA with SNARE-associated domain
MDRIGDLLASLSAPWGYAILFASSFAENVFPPAPGDTVTVLGALLVGRGRMAFVPAYLSTLAGSVAGFMTCYAAGRKWGRGWFRGRRGKLFSERHLDRVERWFGRYGDWVLVFNRFLSGFRAVVSFAAGIAALDVRKVFLYALIGCALWNGLLMGMGLWMGEHWTVMVENYQRIVFGVIAAGLAVWWIRKRVHGSKFKVQS